MMNNLSAIERLDRVRDLLNHPAIDHTDIIRKIKSVFRDFKYQKHPYTFKIPGLVRATAKDDINWFDKLDRFSYPPKEVLTNFGRCNCPHQPVFYCSDDNVVPVLEVRPKINSFVAVSHWCGRGGKEIEFKAATVGTQVILDNLEEDSPLISTLLKDDIFRDDTGQDIKDIDEYVGKIFIEEGDDDNRLYWLTNAITEALMGLKSPTSDLKLNGIIYPSLASNFKGINIALNVDFVKKNLVPCGVSIYQYVEEYKLKRIKTLLRPKSKDSALDWDEIPFDGNLFDCSPNAPVVYKISHVKT